MTAKPIIPGQLYLVRGKGFTAKIAAENGAGAIVKWLESQGA